MLVVAINFAPELTGIGKYVGEMTEWLAARGISARVIAAPPYYPAWTVSERYSRYSYVVEELAGARVYRCPLWVPRRPRGISRVLHLLTFAISSSPVILWQAVRWRPDVVFVVEPPLVCAFPALISARLAGALAWLHIQDFEVDAAFELGLLKGGTSRRVVLAVERWLMRRFDIVSSISDRMLAKLRTKGVDDEHIWYFPNWVDTLRVAPIHGPNGLRKELDISDETRVLLYSGNMGAKQGLDILIEAARSFAGQNNVLFLLCGDGAARPEVESAARGMQNVRFIPLQPVERLSELLNLADVHLLPQRADAEDLVMPSKLTAILASGRPVVATARPGSDVARVAAEGGLVVQPGDVRAFVAAIQDLLEDSVLREELGTSGRAYACQHWDRDIVLGRIFKEMFCP